MTLISLDEFRRSLRTAYARKDWLHRALESPEMSEACKTVYAKGAKALAAFHAEHQKAWRAIALLVDKTGKDYPYLDVVPLKKAVDAQMKEDVQEFQYVIKLLKSAKPQGKTAGVLSWLSSWHPGILAAKAALSAAKFIHQKLRAAKDPDAYAAVRGVREAVKALGQSKIMLGEIEGGLYTELQQMLVRALMDLSELDEQGASWEVGESWVMEPVHAIYPLGEHTSYLWMGSPIKKALATLEIQAKSGPPLE